MALVRLLLARKILIEALFSSTGLPKKATSLAKRINFNWIVTLSEGSPKLRQAFSLRGRKRYFSCLSFANVKVD